MCYVCKTDFSKHGCQTAAHRWAAPPGLNLWPQPHTDGADAKMLVSTPFQFALLTTTRMHIGKNPGPKCAGVPEPLLLAYLRHPADGSIAHLLNTHQIVTPANKRYFDLLLSLKLAVTKPMIGNLQKPPPADDQRLVCTVSFNHGHIDMSVYANCSGPWLDLRPPGSLAMFQTEHHAVTKPSSPLPLDKSLDKSLVQPFQARLLQRLMAHEATTMSDQLWINTGRHNISRSGDWLSCDMRDAHTPQGGIVNMPPGSGKTRVLAALIHARPMTTLIMVQDDAVAQHWIRELALFAASAMVVTLTQVQQVPSVVANFERVIYDDCVRYLSGGPPPVAPSAVQWALTTPGDYAKARPSAWLRFLFAAGAKADDGLLGMICHNYTHMTKAHNAVYAQLMAVLMFSEPVPPSLLPVCVSSTVVSTPDAVWLEEYVRCWHFVQSHHAVLFGHKRNIAGRFLGAVAGNMPFDTADEIGDCDALPDDDQGMCAICHEKYVHPHRTACAHYFCRSCINEWTATVPNCPMCRQQLEHATAKPCVVGSTVALSANAKKIADTAALAMSYICKNARIVILSRYESVRRQLMQQLKSKMACASVSGCVTPNVTVFAADVMARVLVAQPQALETKILQQCNVGTLIFAEPCVDAALQEQISKRLMRLGQSTQLYMITVVTANTYEAVMHTKTEQECRELK
jgi:hypothetical protein